MRGGGACSGDGNMRQRGKIVYCIALAIYVWSKLAVGYTRANGDGARVFVQDNRIELLQGNLVFDAIGNSVERMPRPERPQFAATFHNLLHFFDGLRRMQMIGTILVIASPIGAMRGWRFT
jgi:hypothetical protein